MMLIDTPTRPLIMFNYPSKSFCCHSLGMCYVERKYWYQPMWWNLQAINVTVEWIVQLGSCDYEYLIYKAFRQKSESVRFWFWTRYCTSVKRFFLSKLLKRIILRALCRLCWCHSASGNYTRSGQIPAA